jgi:hypothetical protein
LINSYLIYKGKLEDIGKRAYRDFREALLEELRNTSYLKAEEIINKRHYNNSMPAVNQEALAHNSTRLKVRKYCI